QDSTYVLPDIDSTALIMQNLVDRVAANNGVDVNLYDPYGNVVYKSEAEVFDMGVLSTKMHPKAFYHLKRQQQVQYLQNENMSSLRFQSIYRAVRDQEGTTRYYLNIPFYTSEFELEQEISNFLVAIINLNAFVFLIAGTIAVVITNRITRSFSVIGDKMKAITLGRTNEEIEWKRNDEIGELIKQYNKMVRQLEQSAEALAKSEREGAWREMARQVAHEIKNPLTPMKLSIQYLQKAITNGQPNVKELTTNVASTLIEQIDHLSKIAADFGRFANIGNRNLEIFDLHTVLESLKDLYSSNPDVNLVWRKVDEEVTVEADRTHMNRLFTNLLTNAIDACSSRKHCRIEIIEKLKDDSILVQVKDNGEGIPEEMQPKIFTPNFTTKSSGTGLGLAICKSIVEQAGGDIWFETAQGTGSSFYVQLPLANSF
ncbi:MAG: ATP-binding protein, partial [Chitinophagaceae bacterium]